MGEVERAGEAEVLGTLAQQINEEHRAAFKAMVDTLNHAVVAGALLLEAKKLVKHGEWGAWLEENFEGSDRTTRDYMRLARRRGEIEEAKRQGSAILSISGALQYLGQKPRPLGWHNISSHPEGQRQPLSEEQRREISAEVEREHRESLAKSRIWEQANNATKKGDPDPAPPLDMPAEEWRNTLALVEETRVRDAGYLMRGVTNHLSRWLDPDKFRPDEAGKALARMEGGEDLIAALSNRVAWLTRVVEEAEQRLDADPMQDRE